MASSRNLPKANIRELNILDPRLRGDDGAEMSKNKKVQIDKEKCKGCELCIDVCPHDALILLTEVNLRGLRYVALSDPDKCTGCGLCYMMCPDCALEIKEGKKKNEKKIS